jgi:tRNA(Arg) A34 adenosine deaminase TadA
MSRSGHPVVRIEYPDWVDEVVDWERRYTTDGDRMRLAIAIARENVLRDTGGPFGAAIFQRDTGRVVSVGMNCVVRLKNSPLHGEIIAFMTAQQRLGSYTLNVPGGRAHDIYTSCEPCAMCLGATLWSGVKRVVYGAARDDAARLDFEEGPVFEASYQYLAERGLEVDGPLLRDEARDVLELYRSRSGKIYNA